LLDVSFWEGPFLCGATTNEKNFIVFIDTNCTNDLLGAGFIALEGGWHGRNRGHIAKGVGVDEHFDPERAGFIFFVHSVLIRSRFNTWDKKEKEEWIGLHHD
jgi:hypothetical protein